MKPDVGAWPEITIGNRLAGGNRNQVWAGWGPDGPVAVRRSRREPDSLAWELGLLTRLDALGFVVPAPVPTVSGELSSGETIVQHWIEGREPTTEEDWRLVAGELQRLHRTCPDVGQRPGCLTVLELSATSTSVDADMAALPAGVANDVFAAFEATGGVPVSVIHGDPGASNLRITIEGGVGILDWDESRVDVVVHDLSNLGIQVLNDADHHRARRASDAWEVANAWITEPAYARRRLVRLRALER